MRGYIRIMEYFWLGAAIVTFVMVTIMCLKEDFTSWAPYYFFSLAALGFYFIRRYMRKRMEKHLAWLHEQKMQQGQK